jgi:two-component sensor histidine kinase
MRSPRWKDKGLIRVSLAEDDQRVVTLAVSDNGRGMPEDAGIDAPATLGLNLVSMLVRQLNGTIEIGRSGGTAFAIRFRKSCPGPGQG